MDQRNRCSGRASRGSPAIHQAALGKTVLPATQAATRDPSARCTSSSKPLISSNDPTDPENELLQYKATRLLRDAWHRAVYLSARGTFQIRSEAWVIDKNERRFGTALRIVCEIESMIPDEPLPIAPVDTVAVLALDELDQTDTLTVSPADAP